MFGSLGLPEILVILVLALLIFGPKRLPEVGRTIGKGLAEFRRATTDLKRSVNAELSLEEDERPATSRRPVQGTGRTVAEVSTSYELPAAAAASEATDAPATSSPVDAEVAAPEGTAPRASDTPLGADSEAAAAPEGEAPGAEAAPTEKKPGGGAEPVPEPEPPASTGGSERSLGTAD